MGQLIRQIKKKNGLIRRFAEEEDAVGVVEIILILVVLIGLVIIFKEQLTELVQSILSKIAKQSNSKVLLLFKMKREGGVLPV